MFDKLFGLPAHPLLIHAPIVLLPILAIVTVVLAVRADWRRRAGWWATAALGLLVVLVFAAKQSGEAFIEGFDRAYGAGAIDIEEHEEFADTTMLLTIVWFAVFGVLVTAEWFARRGTTVADSDGRDGSSDAAPARIMAKPAVSYGLAGVATVLAVLSTVWMIRTGHEGARVTWEPQVDQLFPD